jgi:hypothetical protein
MTTPSPHAFRLVLCTAALVLALIRGAHADPVTLKLRDGSTISGEVVSLTGGLYTVQSRTLGTLTVREADVQSMTRDSGKADAAPAGASSEVEAIQQRIANDPQAMQAVRSLQDNPNVQEILADPALMSALQSGNLQALLANPKLARLAADPEVQAILRQLNP